MSTLLTIEGICSVTRCAGNEILHGVDLEVRSGEVHALMGPNGSGQVDAVARAHGAQRLRGDRRFDHHRRRGAASACPPGSARSAGSSSRCSIRWRCPAFRSRHSSPLRCAPATSTRPACTTRCRRGDRARRARRAAGPRRERRVLRRRAEARRDRAARGAATRSSRSSTRSTPVSTSTRCARCPAGSSA